MNMRATPPWADGKYILLKFVNFDPEGQTLRLGFMNGDLREISSEELWGKRPEIPDWEAAFIDPNTGGAIGVPTEDGSVEIPADVIRSLTDREFGEYMAALGSRRMVDRLCE